MVRRNKKYNKSSDIRLLGNNGNYNTLSSGKGFQIVIMNG